MERSKGNLQVPRDGIPVTSLAFAPLGHLTGPCVSFLMLILPSHFSICAAKAGTQVVLNKREIRCLRKECWLLTNLGSCKLFLNVFQVDRG